MSNQDDSFLWKDTLFKWDDDSRSFQQPYSSVRKFQCGVNPLGRKWCAVLRLKREGVDLNFEGTAALSPEEALDLAVKELFEELRVFQ